MKTKLNQIEVKKKKKSFAGEKLGFFGFLICRKKNRDRRISKNRKHPNVISNQRQENPNLEEHKWGCMEDTCTHELV